MSKLTWINFLHFYQPPTADKETVVEAAEKSYKRLISALNRNPKIKFTVNLAGCLLERLDGLGYADLLFDFKKLAKAGRLELTGSAAFHPLLALLPEKEITRQIKLNEDVLKKYFGKFFRPRGFFIPEAAYSAKVARIIKRFKYDWLILDEISAGSAAPDFSRPYVDKNSGLKIIFRQREASRGYVPKKIFDLIDKQIPATVITATDAELYGLRHGDFTATFEKLLKRREIKTLSVSRYLSGLKNRQIIALRPSSWESTEAELKNNSPYFLWHDKKNKIQNLLWQLADLAIMTVNKNKRDANYFWARQHLDKGLASCTFWWASAHDFGLYGPISWNPDEIEKGVNELIRGLRSLAGVKTRPEKIKGEKLYLKIKQLIWHKHWNYHWLRAK